MAEAQAFNQIHVRNVALQVDDYGWTINLRFQIPRPGVLGVVLRRWGRSIWTTLFNIMYPIGLLFTFVFSVVLAIVVVYADEESWMRNGYIANFVWDIAQVVFPFWSFTPLYIKIGVLAAEVGMAAAFATAIINQLILRLLLSWHGWMTTPQQDAKVKTVIWGSLVKLLSGRLAPKWLLSAPRLYSFSRLLPILPVPDLNSTVKKYMMSVKGLLSDEEYTKTETQAENFLANEGPQLQWYLKFKWLVSSNYISDWWEQYVYLSGRTSLMVNSNYYFLDYENNPTNNREARAAVVLREFLLYKHKVDNQDIEPFIIRDTVPLCMEQHRRMFATTRVPGRAEDTIVHLDLGKENHIVVLHKGFYYKLNCYSSDILSSKTLLSAKVFEHRLNRIKEDATNRAASEKAQPLVSCLTSLNRTRWAELREDYLGSGLNKTTLAIVESALFLVVLDDLVPKDESTMGTSLLAGVGNRWYDKSFCLVAFANGRIGVNAEHTWADALVAAHLWECTVMSDTTPDNLFGYDEATGLVKAVGDDMALVEADQSYRPHRLYWDIPTNGNLDSAITIAVEEATASNNDLDLRVWGFRTWGKSRLKEFKLSPDSTIQMALQLAYFRDQNKFGLTYEASMTRLFRHGRTETIRSLSEYSVAFVKAMEDAKATTEEKVSLLKTAVGHHNKCSTEARIGEGVDRHLFGLYVVSKGKQIDSDFLKAALSEPWILSTSQQPANQTTLWNPDDPKNVPRIPHGGGFGPVANDGYGVSYMLVGKTSLFFHVSSKRSASNTLSSRFEANIKQALVDIEALFPRSDKK
eukprot:m.258774 g.258774  ORF g.258774 m.258774 type:complete len:805 (-) comp37068_c0_seq1:58-2472(-)